MSFATRAAAAVALAGLMLAAVFAPLLHLVLVPHVRCAAHGELVHAGSAEAPAPEETAFTTSAGGDEHEHCLTLSAQRSAVLSPATRITKAVERTMLEHGVALPARPSLQALELAPKASPPV